MAQIAQELAHSMGTNTEDAVGNLVESHASNVVNEATRISSSPADQFGCWVQSIAGCLTHALANALGLESSSS